MKDKRTKEQRQADYLASKIKKLNSGKEIHLILPEAAPTAALIRHAATQAGLRLAESDGGTVDYIAFGSRGCPVVASVNRWLHIKKAV